MKQQTAVEWLIEQITFKMDGARFASFRETVNLAAYFDQAKQLEAEQSKPHQIKVSHHMEVMAMWDRNEITYSRMVEILNEIAAGKHKEGIEI